MRARRRRLAQHHGSIALLPRKRSARHRCKGKSFPKDDPTKPCHLTGSPDYKAGTTQIVRDVGKLGFKLHKNEVIEAVTIVETPLIIVVSGAGYVETPL